MRRLGLVALLCVSNQGVYKGVFQVMRHSAFSVSRLTLLGISVMAIIVSAAGAANANPITLELISDSSISGLNASLGQELTLGPSLNEWHFAGQDNKELAAISSDATNLAVTGKNFGITDSCFYVVTPAETTATPEPISMLLLGTGLVGTAAGIRYRRRKSVSNS